MSTNQDGPGRERQKFDRKVKLPKRLWPRFTPWRGKQFRTKQRTVGFLGLTGAGKTVFITSLVNQLKDFDSDNLPLKPKKRKCKKPVTVTEVEGGLKPRLCAHMFDYDSYRDAFKRHQWPEKTQQLQEYRARYVRDDRPHTLYDVSMLDIPGERLGDICMIGAGFEEWSDFMLKMLRLDPYSRVSGEFMQLVSELSERPDTMDTEDEAQYIRAYKNLLVRLVTDLKNTAVSPSAFYIDANDRYIPEDKLDLPVDELKNWLVNNRFSGLSAESEFAPLPAAIRSKNTELSKKYCACYKNYLKTITLPVYNALHKCDSLVILVDVAALLYYGEGMINAQDKLLEQLTEGLKPGTVTPEFMDRLMPGPRIHRMVFVASKADRIHPRDYGRLQSLLQQICGIHAKRRVATTGLKTSYEVCAAVDSTEVESAESGIEDRYLQFKDGSGNTVRFEIPQLPDEIPNSIEPGHFVYPEPVPVLPGINRKPPKHIGLEKIVDVLLG